MKKRVFGLRSMKWLLIAFPWVALIGMLLSLSKSQKEKRNAGDSPGVGLGQPGGGPTGPSIQAVPPAKISSGGTDLQSLGSLIGGNRILPTSSEIGAGLGSSPRLGQSDMGSDSLQHILKMFLQNQGLN